MTRQRIEFRKKQPSNGTFSWSLYDFANSAYGSLVAVLLFPLFYKSVILGNDPHADLWWGIAAGTSILLSGLLAPIIGALADVTRKRKAIFVCSTLIAVAATALLAITGGLDPISATLVFILANMSYNISATVYDSLLTNVSTKETRGKISGMGWSLGYAGGILATLLVLPLLKSGVESQFYWVSFIIVAAFYLIFSIPAFINVKDVEAKTEKVKNPIASSFRNIFNTFKNWRQNKHLFMFLLAYYFLTEGIATTMYFIALFANTTLKVSSGQIAIVFMTAQLVAIPSTIIAGRYGDRMGHKRVLIWALIGWCIGIALLSITKSLGMLYASAIVIGLVIGQGQANARAWYNNLIPSHKRGELFGFNAFASKISSTVGPPLFGIISVATGSQRIAIFTILIYFLISLVLFMRMKDD
jgi:UMF1 family MFS transporter